MTDKRTPLPNDTDWKEKMTPEMVRKIIDRNVSLKKCLEALYLEVDASIVESVEVYVANAIASELNRAHKEGEQHALDLLLERIKDGTMELTINVKPTPSTNGKE